MKNSYSEELELASLLVHVEIINAKVDIGHGWTRWLLLRSMIGPKTLHNS